MHIHRVALLAILAFTANPGGASQAPLPSLVLELAPGELGELQAEGLVLLGANSDGSGNVSLLDRNAGKVHVFDERSGRPTHTTQLEGSLPGATRRMRLHEGGFVLLGADGVKVYGPDGFREAEAGLFQGHDLIPMRLGYVVSLTNIPDPTDETAFIGRRELQTQRGAPRLIELGSDLEVDRSGLFMRRENMTASRGAGRKLYLASDGRRTIYAVEHSNYTLYELAPDLGLRQTLRDPELSREDPEGDADARSEVAARLRERGEELVAARGAEVSGSAAPAKPRSAAPGPAAIAFHNEPVVEDVAWEPTLDRLLVLLHDGVATGGPALDVIDPTTGEVQRYRLYLPVESGQPINQIAVGDDYLWLRPKYGRGRLYRVPLLDLQTKRGSKLQLPELESFVDAAD